MLPTTLPPLTSHSTGSTSATGSLDVIQQSLSSQLTPVRIYVHLRSTFSGAWETIGFRT